MHRLIQLQKDFQSYLLNNKPTIKTSIVGNIDIYNHAYYARLHETISNDYSHLCKLLGEKKFNKLIYQYVSLYPSHYKSIRWAGKKLPHFMRILINNSENNPLKIKKWHGELAQFEWYLTESFDSNNNAQFTIEALSTLAPEKWPELKFTLSPTLRLINTQLDIAKTLHHIENEIYRAALNKIKTTWIVWRRNDYQVCYRLLEKSEYFILKMISHHYPFASICERISKQYSDIDVIAHAVQKLKQFIIDQLICGIE